MKILLLEDNLLWSTRAVKALRASGHTAEVVLGAQGAGEADMAVVNLSSIRLKPFEAIAELKSRGLKVVGHAGHKEKHLWEMGKQAGCDRIVSNSEMAFKLPQIVAEVCGEG